MEALKSLGNPADPDFRKVHYFAIQKEAKEFAAAKVESVQHVGRLADALGPEEKAKILREAARLVEKGIDPLKAMDDGARHLAAYGE